MKSWKIEDVFPHKFTIGSTTYTKTDNNDGTWTWNDGTSDVHVNASAVTGSNGLMATRGARLNGILEGLIFGILKESAQADTYATDLWDDDTLIQELSDNLQAVFDSMEFETSVE